MAEARSAAEAREALRGELGDEEKYAASKAWSIWEGSVSRLRPPTREAILKKWGDDDFALAFARIENHYFVNEGFFEEGQLIAEAHRLKDIPGIIVQGRYDMCTPAKTAWDLHRAWPEARFTVVPDAGHAYSEPGILHHLIEATDEFAARL